MDTPGKYFPLFIPREFFFVHPISNRDKNFDFHRDHLRDINKSNDDSNTDRDNDMKSVFGHLSSNLDQDFDIHCNYNLSYIFKENIPVQKSLRKKLLFILNVCSACVHCTAVHILL